MAAVVVPVAMLGGSVGASTPRTARPDQRISHDVTADVAVAKQVQEFQTNTKGFCPASTVNAPCDGAEGDYGTIDRVRSRYSNGGAGDYAPSTQAYYGKWMALISGSQAQNMGNGCPSPAVEYCSGPYALFGPASTAGQDNVFPANGFTVTDDVYLSPATAGPAGSVIDDDVEINTSSGTYGIDNVITACDQSGGGFAISFGHGSPGSCSGTAMASTDGWYRFVFVFSNLAGYAYLTMSVYSDSGGTAPVLTPIATSGPQPVGGGSPQPITDWGGPGYLWWPTEDESGVPVANVALQLGQHPTGYTPA